MKEEAPLKIVWDSLILPHKTEPYSTIFQTSKLLSSSDACCLNSMRRFMAPCVGVRCFRASGRGSRLRFRVGTTFASAGPKR